MTTAVHWPGSVDRLTLPGQAEIVGAWVSLTVTVNEHVCELPDASVAVQVTVVVPLAKALPEAGLHAYETPAQLSAAVAVNVATAQH